ncbi:hypothetical protein LPB140_06090 [Sphingorhabdus lutea]|uniref:Uncharacterized protein n=1 Tax=Sphingorhabdus lutea TaxID=1913578 RepID=A0A1L3JBC8_9SPHN|nr:hypothetical protein [Sphingorhabdus lutea]APG62432.1 hypothetical protein LPB140_06090 [Sphingorhabdus lutea]
MNWFLDPVSFQSFKLDILSMTGLGKDAMHVHIGMAIFIIVRLCWRGRGGWFVAWSAALIAALTGEYLDYKVDIIQSYKYTGQVPDAEHWHDIWNTMFWPSILLLIGRWLQPAKKNIKDGPDFIEQDAPIQKSTDLI